MCVLIVEDDQILANVCKRNMRTLGQRAHVVNSGDEAVRQFGEHPYGLVLMDIGLPGKSGLDVARELKRLDSDVPIVAITAGYSSPDECEAAGISAYYLKPILIQQLADIVQKWGRGCCHEGTSN
jgi:CheY-like chemotaxis protein